MLQKIENKENKEKFHAHIEELSGYAADRNLTVTLVSFQPYFFEIITDTCRGTWKYAATLDLSQTDKAPDGTYTVAVGILKNLRIFWDKKGNEMAFGTLRNYRGEIDLVFFTSVWMNCKDKVQTDKIIALKGRIDWAGKKWSKPILTVSSVPNLNRLAKTATRASVSAPDKTIFNEWLDTGIDCLEIENTIKEKCLHEFNDLIQELDSDDLVIDAGKYGMCFTPEFKPGLIKQIANSHGADYVIIPHQDQSLAIFPAMVINNKLLKGDENKEVRIGDFQYMMFLQNIDEAKKIAQILSDASRRIPLIVEEVKIVISEFIKTTPKPSAAMPKEHKSITRRIAVVIGIITGILADYLFNKIIGETGLMFFILMAVIGGAGFAVGCFGSMGLILKIDEREEKKIRRENEKQKENEDKASFDWAARLNNTAKDYIMNRRFDDISGKFLAIEGKSCLRMSPVTHIISQIRPDKSVLNRR
jgi:hypothetical protein